MLMFRSSLRNYVVYEIVRDGYSTMYIGLKDEYEDEVKAGSDVILHHDLEEVIKEVEIRGHIRYNSTIVDHQ